MTFAFRSPWSLLLAAGVAACSGSTGSDALDAGTDEANDATVDTATDASSEDALTIDGGADAMSADCATDASADTSLQDAPHEDARPEETDARDSGPVEAGGEDGHDSGPPPTDGAVCTPGTTRCAQARPALCVRSATWKRAVGRCVPSCVSAPSRFLVDLATLTVLDTTTGLEWERSQSHLYRTWEDAKAYCALSPWMRGHGRLPTAAELQALVMADCSPSIDQAAFPAAFKSPTWTAPATDEDAVPAIHFGTGAQELHAHFEALAVRCVRDQ